MAGAGRQDHVVIRPRLASDDATIRQLNDRAFGSTYESGLIEALRAAGLAVVELVDADGDDIVGHILFSELGVTIDGRRIRSLALAPMAVRQDRRKQGIGGALVQAGLREARASGWQAVIVLGHPGYYPRFGFSADRARPLDAPFSGDAFMALELEQGALSGNGGRVVYPPPFGLAA